MFPLQQSGEDFTGANFDRLSHPIGSKVRHGFPPADGAGHLGDKAIFDFGAVGGGGGLGVGQDRDGGVGEGGVGEDFVELFGGVCHVGGVERTGDGEGNGASAPPANSKPKRKGFFGKR